MSSDRRNRRHVHVSGVAGVGMNAVAQLLIWRGCRVTGSDRFLDQGQRLPVLDKLALMGVELVPQDGQVLTAETAQLVISTAVEEDNPERMAAKALGIQEVHRSEVLAEFAGKGPLAAIAGTSGKTSCTGWLGWVLAACGMDPTVVNGGGVLGWKSDEVPGNVRRGAEDSWWVVEVDESDRSLLRFSPTVALINTITEDHHSLEETIELFRCFARQVEEAVVCGPGVKAYLEGDPEIQATLVEVSAPREVALPGEHNGWNAAAVRELAVVCGVDSVDVDKVLGDFPGVERRLERCSPEGAPAVYDDYAHNPEKIAAAIRAVRPDEGRLTALWRPHGFAPLMHNFEAYADAFSDTLREVDSVWILPVFYAGGTAPKGVSSQELVEELQRRGVVAKALTEYPDTVDLTAEDVLLVMGARDPELPVFAARVGKACGSPSSR